MRFNRFPLYVVRGVALFLLPFVVLADLCTKACIYKRDECLNRKRDSIADCKAGVTDKVADCKNKVRDSVANCKQDVRDTVAKCKDDIGTEVDKCKEDKKERIAQCKEAKKHYISEKKKKCCRKTFFGKVCEPVCLAFWEGQRPVLLAQCELLRPVLIPLCEAERPILNAKCETSRFDGNLKCELRRTEAWGCEFLRLASQQCEFPRLVDIAECRSKHALCDLKCSLVKSETPDEFQENCEIDQFCIESCYDLAESALNYQELALNQTYEATETCLTKCGGDDEECLTLCYDAAMQSLDLMLHAECSNNMLNVYECAENCKGYDCIGAIDTNCTFLSA